MALRASCPACRPSPPEWSSSSPGRPCRPPLVHSFAIALPWTELFIGILILVGLWTRTALALGALEIVVLTFGISFTQNWSVAGLQLIYAIVYAILLAFADYNRWSIDGWRDRVRHSRPTH